MIIIDGHLDLSWNALQGNRNLLNSVYTIRTQENKTLGKGRAQGTVAFPEMRKGRIGLSFVTLFARSTGQLVPYVDYESTTQSYGVARGQLSYYFALETEGHVRIITNQTELNQQIAAWEEWESEVGSTHTPPLGFVITMEGADPILKPSQLEEWKIQIKTTVATHST